MADEFDLSAPSYAPDTTEKAGFWENAYRSAAQVFREGNVPLIPVDSDAEKQLKVKMYEDVEAGLIDKGTFNNMMTMGIDEALEYINTETQLSGYPIVEDLWADVKSENERKHMEDEEVRDRSGVMGDIGYWSAQIMTPMVSPAYWPGMVYGVGTAATFSQAFLRTGVVELGTQLISQPVIADQHEQAGIKYGKSDMLVNGLLSVGGAGVISGLTTIPFKQIKSSWIQKFQTVADKEGVGSSVKPDLDLITSVKEMAPDRPVTEFIDDVVTSQKAQDGKPAALKTDGEVEEAASSRQRAPEPEQIVDEVIAAENLQKQSRLDELTKKEQTGPLTEREMDEFDMLVDELKAVEPDPIIAKHTEEVAKELEQVQEGSKVLDELTDCTM